MIGFGHAAFTRGDVRATFEKLRGDAAGNRGRLEIERSRGEIEFGGRPTDEDGDGVFVLGASDGDVSVLDACGVELGLRFGDVGSRGYPAAKTAFCQL